MGNSLAQRENVLTSFAKKKISLPVFIIFSFCCFRLSAAIGGYQLFDVHDHINEAANIMYLVDYRIGFASRLLIGTLYGFFVKDITPESIYLTGAVSVIVSFALQAVLAGLVIRKSLVKEEYAVAVFTCAFLLHSLTSLENIRIKGCLDTYILIIFLIWLLFYDTLASMIGAPVLCVLGMLIHYSYIFTFMPAVLALTFYGIFFAEKKSRRRLCAASFASGSVLSLSLFSYFVFFANDHLKMTSEETYAYMMSKYVLTPIEKIHMERSFDGVPFFRLYIDRYFYNKDQHYNQLGSTMDELKAIREEVAAFIPLSLLIKYALIFLPLFAVFAALWIACMKKVRGAKKLPFLVFILMPLTLIPACVMSTDVWRWVSASIISQFAVLFGLYRSGSEPLQAVLGNEKLHRGAVLGVFAGLTAVYIFFALRFGIELPINR